MRLNGVSELTITGTNFGANDDDLEVLISAPITDGCRGPHPSVVTNTTQDSLKYIKCPIVSVNGAKTEIVATVDMSDFRVYGGVVVTVGDCAIEVRNNARRLKSDRFEGLEVVK